MHRRTETALRKGEVVSKRNWDSMVAHVRDLEARLRKEEGKREALALDHQPHWRAESKVFTCTAPDCVHYWPCPTYKWATDQPDLAPLKVTRKSE